MKNLIFKGAGTALVTPMNADGSINYPVFRELLHMQIENDADAVVIAGTTGEGSTLTDEEHLELVRVAVKEIKRRIPVIATAGSNNTAHAVWLSKECERTGNRTSGHSVQYPLPDRRQYLSRHLQALKRN